MERGVLSGMYNLEFESITLFLGTVFTLFTFFTFFRRLTYG